MLDKKKIKLMSRMAAYDKKNAGPDLKISSYYKKDYVSLNTLISILWITFGYIIGAALYVLCNVEFLLENLTITKLLLMGAIAVGIYFILLIIYGVCASSFYGAKHHKAKLRAKRYYRDLARLARVDHTSMIHPK